MILFLSGFRAVDIVENLQGKATNMSLSLQEKEQIENMRKGLKQEIEFHKKQIKAHEEALKRHRERIEVLDKH